MICIIDILDLHGTYLLTFGLIYACSLTHFGDVDPQFVATIKQRTLKQRLII